MNDRRNGSELEVSNEAENNWLTVEKPYLALSNVFPNLLGPNIGARLSLYPLTIALSVCRSFLTEPKYIIRKPAVPNAQTMVVHESKPATSGRQLATFSYFHVNPTIHTHEKPYEILINLPQAAASSSGYRRSNQEFEPHECVVEDVRGQEADFGLDQQGVCWRRWEGPDAWKGVNAEKVKRLGHGGIEETYLADVEGFIKRELEHENGQRVERVKVFDYKVGSSRLSRAQSSYVGRHDIEELWILRSAPKLMDGGIFGSYD